MQQTSPSAGQEDLVTIQGLFWEEIIDAVAEELVEVKALLRHLEVDAEKAAKKATVAHDGDYKGQVRHMLYDSWYKNSLPQSNDDLLEKLEDALLKAGRRDIVQDVTSRFKNDPRYRKNPSIYQAAGTNRPVQNYVILSDLNLHKLAAALPYDYRRLSIYLDISDDYIKNIEKDNRIDGNVEMITVLFKTWRQDKTGKGLAAEKPVAEKLCEALATMKNEVLRRRVKRWIDEAEQKERCRQQQAPAASQPRDNPNYSIQVSAGQGDTVRLPDRPPVNRQQDFSGQATRPGRTHGAQQFADQGDTIRLAGQTPVDLQATHQIRSNRGQPSAHSTPPSRDQIQSTVNLGVRQQTQPSQIYVTNPPVSSYQERMQTDGQCGINRHLPPSLLAGVSYDTVDQTAQGASVNQLIHSQKNAAAAAAVTASKSSSIMSRDSGYPPSITNSRSSSQPEESMEVDNPGRAVVLPSNSSTPSAPMLFAHGSMPQTTESLPFSTAGASAMVKNESMNSSQTSGYSSASASSTQTSQSSDSMGSQGF